MSISFSMPTHDDEFSGLDFAAGVLTGARSFRIDKLGRLTGVNVPQVWTPGENTASCRKDDLRGGGITRRLGREHLRFRRWDSQSLRGHQMTVATCRNKEVAP